uniref:Protein phosphatase 1 regulatory subunit n=1 Tax=Anopheles braziliensis TaxID=58242 RepID=A0A2M3Z9U6_9DIPT
MKLLLIALVALSSIKAAWSVNCSIESFEYAPGMPEEFCVLKGLKTDRAEAGNRQTDPSITRVAIVEPSLKRLTAAFYERFPRLQHLVVRDTDLEQLHIAGNVRIIDASGNKIKSVTVQGGGALRELNLRSNPISDISPISGLVGLTKLNLGNTLMTKEHAFEFSDLARLTNLTELYIDDMDIYYLDNTRDRPLPSLQLLDLSRNSFTPSNFHLDLFRSMPKLEVLLLRHCLFSTMTVHTEELRTNFPSLKQIYLEGNQLECELFSNLLELLKTNGIEPVEPEQPEQCNQGFTLIARMCCHSFKLPPPTPPPLETTTTSTTTTTTLGPATVPTPKTAGTTPQPPKDRTGTSSPPSSTNWGLIVGSIVGAIVVIAAVVLGVIFVKKRKTEGMQAVPRNEPKDTIEM